MESKSRLIFLIVAGILVAFGAIAVRNHFSEEEAPAVVDKGVNNRVIVAKHDIAPGTLVQPAADLDWDVLAPEAIKDEMLREGSAKPEDFAGAISRKQLKAGEPITHDALAKAGEGGFMSAVLEPGMRAISLAVTATSGNAGFVSPGDRVDLIVTHHVKAKDAQGSESVVSETFVRDVRVLAVDQMLDNPENKAVLAKTVTVEVTPRQAEQVSVAAEMGKVSIALRSLAGTAPAPKPVAAATTATPENEQAHIVTDLYGNYTRDSDISQALGHDSVNPRIRVIRGDQVENVELY